MFDEEPSSQDVNLSIVECLEGSEHEDELVARQMQDALESGQLDSVSRMLELMDEEEDDSDTESGDEDDEIDPWDYRGADSI